MGKMANDRLELHELLCQMLGSRNVYFQPPATIQLKYPCIIYQRSKIAQKYADNRTYNGMVCYSILLITRTPESEFVSKLLELPYCSYDRYYAADSLNHDTFTIYF